MDDPDYNILPVEIAQMYLLLEPVEPTLVHLDYWPGNILWQDDKISGVVDWEEAAFGDAAIDVAYCRAGKRLHGSGK